jgi:hypothetical protein
LGRRLIRAVTWSLLTDGELGDCRTRADSGVLPPDEQAAEFEGARETDADAAATAGHAHAIN